MLYREIRLTERIAMAEDLLFCSEAFANTGSLLLLGKVVYRNRENGTTGLKFESKSCIESLDTIKNTVQFARVRRQLRAHKGLLIRTIAQLPRAYRRLPRALTQQVLAGSSEGAANETFVLYS